MAASSQWVWVNCSFKLYTTSHVFGHFWISLMVAIYPVVKAMHYIYIYKYLWNSPHFMSTFYSPYFISTSLVGSNPRSLDNLPSSITRHISDHQSKASQIYSYIAGSPNKEIVYKDDKKYDLNISDDGHFEFYDLWENGVINSLAYGRNGFSANFSYRNNKWSTFAQKCLQVFN